MSIIANADAVETRRRARNTILTYAGFEVIDAQSGKELLGRMGAARPDVVLLAPLPDIDAGAMCRRLKTDAATCPIPILVLSPDTRALVDGLHAGADACLVDAPEADVLIAQVRALVRAQQPTGVRAQTTFLRTVIDSVPSLITVRDAHGAYLLANQPAAKFHRMTVQTLEGRAASEIGAQVKDLSQEDLDVMRTGEQRLAEVDRIGPDGRMHSFITVKTPLVNADGTCDRVLESATEVTWLKRADQALRNSEERYREADRRKDEFLAVLSHELRNPLAPIRYALPLLQRERLGEDANRAVEVIDRQVHHLTRLVDDLLDVSRITRGKIELRREFVTLGAIVTAAVEAASPAIASARHSLKLAVAEEPIWLSADPGRLAQVVTNLLNNAAKYTPRGGEITLEARRGDGHAIVRVRDTGIGIPEEALPTLFEMFRQVNNPDASQGGLGIGLALSKRLVEMHAGTIEACSAGIGHGAEFVVRLPVAHDAKVDEARPTTDIPPQIGRRLKVLVVDDNADLVEMLAMVIAGLGHDVRKALDGQTAVSAAVSYRPDVVLLDLGLPVMGGIEVAAQLRAHPETASARLVALTGRGHADDRRQTKEAGFEEHLTKPTDPNALARLLARFTTS
jgi:PAS domain S-box-containing protein